jgi:hypothetical protein
VLDYNLPGARQKARPVRGGLRHGATHHDCLLQAVQSGLIGQRLGVVDSKEAGHREEQFDLGRREDRCALLAFVTAMDGTSTPPTP